MACCTGEQYNASLAFFTDLNVAHQDDQYGHQGGPAGNQDGQGSHQYGEDGHQHCQKGYKNGPEWNHDVQDGHKSGLHDSSPDLQSSWLTVVQANTPSGLQHSWQVVL